MNKTLGERIRELREAQDISLREFARKLGDVSAAHISDIELGRRFPSAGLLSKIAKALSVPVEDLRKRDTRPPLEEIKKIIGRDPAFGLAFRKLAESSATAEDLLKLAGRKSDRPKSK